MQQNPISRHIPDARPPRGPITVDSVFAEIRADEGRKVGMISRLEVNELDADGTIEYQEVNYRGKKYVSGPEELICTCTGCFFYGGRVLPAKKRSNCLDFLKTLGLTDCLPGVIWKRIEEQ